MKTSTQIERWLASLKGRKAEDLHYILIRGKSSLSESFLSGLLLEDLEKFVEQEEAYKKSEAKE